MKRNQRKRKGAYNQIMFIAVQLETNEFVERDKILS